MLAAAHFPLVLNYPSESSYPGCELLPVLYAVGMAEKGSPCVSKLGVATETTGVVKE